MTIRDLKEQDVYLQGWVKILKWDYDMENSEMISYSSNGNGENIRDEALDLEIKYMYADGDDFVIEVIEEER